MNQSEEIKSAEEIVRLLYSERATLTIQLIINAMEEYANQFKSECIDKDKRIEELEYKLTLLMSNIENQIITINNSLRRNPDAIASDNIEIIRIVLESIQENSGIKPTRDLTHPKYKQ